MIRRGVRHALVPAVLLTLALAAPAWSAGIDCRRATTPQEHLICNDPALRSADAEMGRLFALVRDATRDPTRRRLVAGQRAWLQQRDRGCDRAGCLGTAIAARLDALRAVAARVSDANPVLEDLDAAWLTGRWRVGAVTPAGLRPGMTLPEPGSEPVFSAGRLCEGSACADFGLEPSRLADQPAAEAISRALGVPMDSVFLTTIRDGRAGFGLVARGDGVVAVSPACDASGQRCGFVQQGWTPIAPDSRRHVASLTGP